jgi:hypothetical protein
VTKSKSSVAFPDRLRIERVVWQLDQFLYDMPRRSRIAKRREVRENLLTAAADVGAKTAIGRLGSTRRLATEYLSAEYGDEPRPSWWYATIFFLTGQLVLQSLFTESITAFRDGIVAADPSATGTFHWTGIAWLQDDVTYTFVDGRSDWAGGAWTPFAWVLYIGGTIAVGRLWRAIPQWRRRVQARTATTAATP